MRSDEPRRGADHNVMREVNRSLVLALVKEGGPVSRASIARSTTLAKPTVSAIVDELIADGLVREIGPGSTAVSGGRPRSCSSSTPAPNWSSASTSAPAAPRSPSATPPARR
ncbi:MarR family transcriptional regulator [Dactylosporangium darangshiense]|uniref:MarR family transcriptional regulator n=1 Tax=Dactylosporangium darangshiense TaxID=579108 RepID=UPI003630DB9E